MSTMLKPTPPPMGSPREQMRDLLTRQLSEYESVAKMIRDFLAALGPEKEGTVLHMRRSGPYGGMKTKDAAVDYIKETGQPVMRHELENVLVARGLRPDLSAEQALRTIKATLTVLMKAPEERKKGRSDLNYERIIKQVGDWVGLEEWPESRFK